MFLPTYGFLLWGVWVRAVLFVPVFPVLISPAR